MGEGDAARRRELEPDLRADLERVLRRLAFAGHIPDRGNIDVRLRLDGSTLRWFEATRIRVPAGELER